MDKIRNKYNPDFHYSKSLEWLGVVSPEDAMAWYAHPCSKALREALEGDLAGIVVNWIGGAYSNEENASATSQRQAKARGMAQSIEDILIAMKDISKLSLRGDNVSHGDEEVLTP